MLRSKHIFHAALLAALCSACTASTGDGIGEDMTRDQARALGGKTDHGLDICEWLGWYGDGICDEFCPHPDPDCAAECVTDDDCAPIFCITAPCPQNVCVAGECVIDMPDRCPPGQRECQTCGDGYVCTPNGVSCPLVWCPPPPPERNCGGFAGLTCEADEYCDYDDDSCGFADQMGTCRPRPEAWIEIYAPVCGCDGVTYSNEGEANGNGVDIQHTGACEPPPPPPVGCRVAGCSSQLCIPADSPPIYSTCEWLPEYICYQTEGTCERQPDGECGWTPTPEFLMCLDRY